MNKKKITNIAVITADFIESTGLDEKSREKILYVLKEEFSKIEGAKFEIYRGDSFQGILYDLTVLLEVVLGIKTAINMIDLNVKSISKSRSIIADFRVSIGIGERSFESKSVIESDGSAFRYSGRRLDTMKSDDRKISLTTGIDDIDDEFEVSFKFLELITNQWSIASAEVIYYLLQGHTEHKIATIINISQAAVNFRKKASGWDAIQMLIKRYKQVVKKHYLNG